mmetsp:Transcript_13726/g.31785  ORF Transcript_13726/g.31785 Transcript_13726/m.31785 type:complete len:307 (+) Transcript_13726:890-1810(+)
MSVSNVQHIVLSQEVELRVVLGDDVCGSGCVSRCADAVLSKILPCMQRRTVVARLALPRELHLALAHQVQAFHGGARGQADLLLGESDNLVGVHGVGSAARSKLHEALVGQPLEQADVGENVGDALHARVVEHVLEGLPVAPVLFLLLLFDQETLCLLGCMCLVHLEAPISQRLRQHHRRHRPPLLLRLVGGTRLGPCAGGAPLVLKNGSVVEICKLLAPRNHSLAIVLNLAGEGVALDLQDAKHGHGRENLEARGVLELVVLKVQHTDRGALAEMLNVLHAAQAVVGDLKRVQRCEVGYVGDGAD